MKTSVALAVLAPLLIAGLTGCATSPAAPARPVSEVTAAPVADTVGSEALTALAAIPVSDHVSIPVAASTDPLSTPVPGRCADATRAIALAAKYHLFITHAEHDRLAGILATCG